MSQDILVVAETDGEALTPVSIELLGSASRIAEGGIVGVVLLGQGADGIAPIAFEHGADRAFVSGDVVYDEFRSDQWMTAVEAACEQSDSAVVLMAQSTIGRDLAPRLAFRRDTAAVMDCVDLKMIDGKLLATRPCYGGNALSTYSFTTSPAIVTIRSKSLEPLESPHQTIHGEIEELNPAGESRTEISGREQVEAEGLQLQDAPIVVSGGRGLGGPDGFEMVEELAAAIGRERAATGSSRAACDLGWYPVSQQVGLTGKVVTPDLYIAIAISGASQHMAGCSGSKAIVAINRDEEANIFKSARYGIVGDYKQVLPPLIEALRRLD